MCLRRDKIVELRYSFNVLFLVWSTNSMILDLATVYVCCILYTVIIIGVSLYAGMIDSPTWCTQFFFYQLIGKKNCVHHVGLQLYTCTPTLINHVHGRLDNSMHSIHVYNNYISRVGLDTHAHIHYKKCQSFKFCKFYSHDLWQNYIL